MEVPQLLSIMCVCVCVCVCISRRLSLFPGKIKIYIHTQLSECDINHNNEISGHTKGSEVRLLGRKTKEKL